MPEHLRVAHPLQRALVALCALVLMACLNLPGFGWVEDWVLSAPVKFLEHFLWMRLSLLTVGLGLTLLVLLMAHVPAEQATRTWLIRTDGSVAPVQSRFVWASQAFYIPERVELGVGSTDPDTWRRTITPFEITFLEKTPSQEAVRRFFVWYHFYQHFLQEQRWDHRTGEELRDRLPEVLGDRLLHEGSPGESTASYRDQGGSALLTARFL